MALLDAILGLAVFWLILIFVSSRVNLEAKGVLIAPLVLIWQTNIFRKLFMRIANEKTRTFWLKVGNICAFLALQLFFILPVILLVNIFLSIISKPGPILSLNPIKFLNLEIILLLIPAILFSIVIHEFLHGIMATSEGVRVEKTGIMLVLAIFTVFLQNAVSDLEKISKRARLRIVSVGVISSLLIALVFLPILAISGSLLAPLYEDASGALVVGVEPNSPAETVELKRGDVITGIKLIEFRTIVDYFQINSSRDLITNLRKIPSGNPFILVTKSGDIQVTGKDPPKNSLLISGSDIGAHFYDYKKPKSTILSKFLPYWIELELIWLININLILGLFNILPLPFSDGKIILETLIDRFPAKIKPVFMKSCYSISGILILLNLYVTLFS